MPQYRDKIENTGGINRDISVEILPTGDYPDALDISYLSDGTGASKSITPKLGNRFAADMGSVTAQNKKYRLYIDMTGTSTLAYEVTFYKTDTTTVLFTASFTNSTLAAVEAAIAGAAASAGYAINISNTGVFLLIEFAPTSGGVPTNYYDYFIEDTGADALEQLYVYQEAIDLTLEGELNVIGSYDLLGDLFIWSTSQTELPSDLGVTITSITHTTVLTNIVIDFASAHGLQTGQRILVQGVEVLTGANGYWIVVVTSTTQIQLALSESVAQLGQIFTGLGSITINPSGIGEIGVAQKVQVTQAWTYTRLLRSKEWNFVTKKQIDTHVEQNSVKKSLYWTDDYKVPRAMYYEGAYSTDGALSFNGGIYDYGTIAAETVLILANTNIVATITNQLQFGGGLISGGKSYCVRMLTANVTPSEFTPITNKIEVFSADASSNIQQILGDAPSTTTTKVNEITVTGIPSSVFKFIELCCIEYVGGAVTAYIVRREVVVGETMILQHTGFENNTTIIDAGTVGQIYEKIITAKNIRAIDNRLILSNITSQSQISLSDWAQNITHSVSRYTLQGWDYPGTNTGEYLIPLNSTNYVGYMINETYRIGIRVLFRNGSWSNVFFVQDITINDDATFARRISALPDLSLSANNGNDVYVPYLEFSNIDMEYLVDGTPLRDLISGISFVRANVDNPQVLASGMVILSEIHPQVTTGGFQLHVGGYFSNQVTPSTTDSLIYELIRGDGNITQYSIPYGVQRRPSGTTFTSLVNSDYYTNTYNIPGGVGQFFNGNLPFVSVNKKQEYASFYSPDILFGGVVPQNQSQQKLKIFGGMSGASFLGGLVDARVQSYYREYYPENLFVQDTYDIDELANISSGEQFTFNNGDKFNKYLDAKFFQQSSSGSQIDVDVDQAWLFEDSPVMRVNGTIINAHNQNADNGVFYGQIFNDIPDQYGAEETTIYITCGHYLETIGLSGIITSGNVFGGDTHTQRIYFKDRYVSSAANSSNPIGATSNGFGGGSILLCQSRVNSQMKYDDATQFLFPKDTQNRPLWLESDEITRDLFSYDTSYTPTQAIILAYAAFDDTIPFFSDFPCRIAYSQLKPQGALIDFYRIFLPLDFKDLDNSDGEITHHEKVNGELFTLQPKKWQRQYFNTRGTLDVRGVSEVLIGDGSVMSRDGQTISNFGCSNKWSVIKGKSAGGNDTIYWIDLIHKQAIRFGGDGTIGLSTIKGLQSFLANNLTWAIANDAPADGEGICGVWDERYKELIWTIRAVRGTAGNLTSSQDAGIPQEWRATTNFAMGNVVRYDGYATDFNQLQNFYRSLSSNNLNHLPTDTTYWEVVPLTDTNYYNVFTLVFSEIKNRFTSFYTPAPKIYLQWQNSYLSPRPVSTVSRLYENNRGDYLSWYLESTSELNSDGYVDILYNKDDSMPKLFLAFLIDSSIIPYQITFNTAQHTSTSLAADFKQMLTVYSTAIKNDTTLVTPIGYTRLWGQYIIARFYFENKVFSKIDTAVVKFNSINRNYTG